MAVHVRCRETADDEAVTTRFDLSIEVSGVARRRVDPAAWDAIGSVGVHDVVPGAEGFRIDIACRVEPNLPPGSSPAHRAARSRGS
jgi:hypothetical protein